MVKTNYKGRCRLNFYKVNYYFLVVEVRKRKWPARWKQLHSTKCRGKLREINPLSRINLKTKYHKMEFLQYSKNYFMIIIQKWQVSVGFCGLFLLLKLYKRILPSLSYFKIIESHPKHNNILFHKCGGSGNLQSGL